MTSASAFATIATGIPDVDQCRRLMEHYGMLDNIRRHSFVVAKIAAMLVHDLNETRQDTSQHLSFPLVVAGALLHDIGKTQCLSNNCDHASFGAEICRTLALDTIADIVEHHVILPKNTHTGLQHEEILAREIVYYADKRVNHEEIVPLDVRLAYILQRYGRNDPNLSSRIQTNFHKCQHLEEHIFSHLPYDPTDIQGRLATLSWLDDFFSCHVI